MLLRRKRGRLDTCPAVRLTSRLLRWLRVFALLILAPRVPRHPADDRHAHTNQYENENLICVHTSSVLEELDSIEVIEGLRGSGRCADRCRGTSYGGRRDVAEARREDRILSRR